MPFWPSNALETLRNDEDKQFLLSMQTDRLAVMAGVDIKLTKTEKNAAERRNAAQKRVNIEATRTRSTLEKDTSLQQEPFIEPNEDEEFSPGPSGPSQRKHRRFKKTGW